MKVLYVDHPEADYLAAQLYIGLCQELGKENVIDYPYKDSYHGRVHTYASIYETDPGPGPYHTWEVRDGVPMGRTPPFEWMPAWPGRAWSHEETAAALLRGEFQLVILASPRRNNTAALADLALVVGLDAMPPIVIVDGEDSETIHYNLIDRFRAAAYFKRELVEVPDADPYPVERERVVARGGCRILPCPLAPHVRSRQLSGQDVDVGLFGGSNTPAGLGPWWDAVRKSKAQHMLFGRLPYDAYLAQAARCRITVAVRGHSKDSLRSWEMLALGGSLVLIQSHDLIRCHPLVGGEHCIYFEDPSDLRKQIDLMLGNEDARSRIAAAGHEHALAHHTPKARAAYLLRESGVVQ